MVGPPFLLTAYTLLAACYGTTLIVTRPANSGEEKNVGPTARPRTAIVAAGEATTAEAEAVTVQVATPVVVLVTQATDTPVGSDWLAVLPGFTA